MKQQTIITVLFLLSTWLHAIAQQQPTLLLQSFEYIREDEFAKGKYWLDAAEAAWIKDSIRKDFAGAIYQRWGLVTSAIDLSTKPLGFFSSKPKFNTKLKDKQPNTWYMFLQVFSQANSSLSYYDTAFNLIVSLHVKCRIINSDNDSLVHDKDLTVDVFTEPVPPGEVVLTKLPVHPAEFVKIFDSIAIWLFSQGMEKDFKSLTLKPACALSEPLMNEQPLTQLAFANNDTCIGMVTQPLFSLKNPGPRYKKLTKKKNFGGNTATGAVTLLTGVGLNKSKTNDYRADFPFVEDTDSIHCIINYWERKVADRERTSDGVGGHSLESGEYIVAERRTDSSYMNFITLHADTLANFTITYMTLNEQGHYTSLWDGADSTTIMPLPKEWNNNAERSNLLINGTIEGNDFTMRSSRERTVKTFYLNNNPVLSIYGRAQAVKALQFQQLPVMQLKLFTILASLPYEYFNYALD